MMEWPNLLMFIFQIILFPFVVSEKAFSEKKSFWKSTGFHNIYTSKLVQFKGWQPGS